MSKLNKKMLLTPDLHQERLDTLKKLFPDIFTMEGNLDPEELNRILALDQSYETERFDFRWFGKSEAKRRAFSPSKSTLIYDAKRSVNPGYANGNMIIEGENLEVMKCLLSAYRESVKCIYIDPPYNKDKDYVYSDIWNESKEDYWAHIGVTTDGVILDSNLESSGRFHSNWLSMIYSRLLLSRQLLQEDGIIFISIDDTEITNLKKVCDEVFDPENFLTTIIVRANSRGQTYKQIARTHEYILVYTKSPETELYELEKAEENDDLIFLDDISKFNIRELRNRNPKFGKHNRRNLYYSVFVNDQTADKDNFYPVSLVEDDTFTIEVRPINSEGKDSCWRWSKGKFNDNNNTTTLKSNLIAKKKQDGSFGIYEKYRKTTFRPKSIWEDNKFLTETGTVELGELNLAEVFEYPKPVELIKRCILMATEDGDLIMDFFAGSGTTGQALFELNQINGIERKMILIQIPELITQKTDTGKRALAAGFKKISDITIERNKRVIQNIEKKNSENIQLELNESYEDDHKAGFKVYKLGKSSFPRTSFKPDKNMSETENLKLLNKYIEEKECTFSTKLNRNFIWDEVLLKNGFMLNYSKEKMKRFSKNSIYLIIDEFKECICCLDQKIMKETLKELEAHKDKIFICLESALDTTMKWNLKHLFGDKLVSF